MSKAKSCCFLCLFLIPSLLLSGCNSNPVLAKYNTDSAVSISSQTAESNDNYSLSWDDEGKYVLFEDLDSGKIWSNIPHEYYLDGGMSANVNSTLNITVADISSMKQDTLSGYTEVVENGRIFCEKIESGIKITYCFDNYKISIPVNYILRQDSLFVTIDTPNIIEDGSEYLLISVSLAPFLCAAKNSPDGAYLFVPSGSGALMYATETADKRRSWSGEVYGTDASRPIPEVITNEEPIRLPVFGVKDGDNALLGIIEEGAESAVIEAEAGNARTGYSSVYPTFYFRGYDVFEQFSYALMLDDLTRVSEARSKNTVSVGYYPMSGSEADYNNMAKRYRQYLQETNALKINESPKSPYSLTLLGGVVSSSSVLGIPQKKLNPMTTFKQAETIISELYDLTGIAPTVRLSGFGDNGINIGGKLAGGYNFPSIFGRDKQRLELADFCLDKNIALFTDFDLMRYGKSGGGFSYGGDSAKSAMLTIAEKYAVKTPLRTYNKNEAYRFLKREQLTKAADKLLKTAAKKNLSGISLSTLGSLAYSDYSSETYFCKGSTGQYVRGVIEKAQSEGFPVASGANAYAAFTADMLFDTPLWNGGYNALDEEIPFYQMIFHGAKPLFSPAVNLTADAQKQIMLAAIGGTGVGFSLIHDFDVDFMETDAEKLYGALYKDNKALIQDVLENYTDFFESVSDAAIERYEILSKNISKTIFDNGVVLYANHNGEQAESPIGILDAYGFRAQ